MALIDQATLAGDATFRSKVKIAAMRNAMSIINRAATTKNVVDEKAWQLAIATMVDGCTENLDRFCYGLAAWPSLPAVPTDTDIVNGLQTIWNALAGVTGKDAA